MGGHAPDQRRSSEGSNGRSCEPWTQSEPDTCAGRSSSRPSGARRRRSASAASRCAIRTSRSCRSSPAPCAGIARRTASRSRSGCETGCGSGPQPRRRRPGMRAPAPGEGGGRESRGTTGHGLRCGLEGVRRGNGGRAETDTGQSGGCRDGLDGEALIGPTPQIHLLSRATPTVMGAMATMIAKTR